MPNEKKSVIKEASRPRNLLALFTDDAKEICGHPMVLIASRSVRRELEVIVGGRFEGRHGVPRNMARLAEKFEDALDLLKEALLLVAVDRIIHRTCPSRDSGPTQTTVSRGNISQHPLRTLVSRHLRV
jgi:hypothetical protein